MKAIRLLTNKKLLKVLIPTSIFIYSYEPAYIVYLGIKRSLIALFFEFAIYLNYKYVRFL